MELSRAVHFSENLAVNFQIVTGNSANERDAFFDDHIATCANFAGLLLGDHDVFQADVAAAGGAKSGAGSVRHFVNAFAVETANRNGPVHLSRNLSEEAGD